LIDPPKFLKTDTPSPQVFRQRMEDLWPEFLDDQIFEARDPDSKADDAFAFELTQEERRYIYLPSFGADSKHLLTGLARREESRDDH